MLILLIFAFVSGLTTILAPCIWPLLPIILSTSTIKGKKRPLGIAIGLVISFTLLTLSISYIVKTLPFNTNILRVISALVIIFLGLTLLVPKLNEWVEGKISRLASRFTIKRESTAGFISGLIIGISLGIVWTPCAGPILATIALLASTLKVNWETILVTLTYTIGTAIPIFLFATLGYKIQEKSRSVNRYLPYIQRAFGVLVILIGLAIITSTDTIIEARLLAFVPSYSQLQNKLETSSNVSKELTSLKTGKDNNNSSLPILSKAPDFIGIDKWLNAPNSISISDLKGKIVLVDFWTYTCINCIRSLPHVISWYNTYKNDNFVVIGIHTPEFQFEHDTSNVENAIKQYGIQYPVGQDNEYDTWNNYQNEYWPAEYLIDANGDIRYTDFGEGSYSDMENNIRKLIKEEGINLSNSTSNIPDLTPGQFLTSETYLGYWRISNLASQEKVFGGLQGFDFNSELPSNTMAYNGNWNIQQEYSTPASNNSSLSFNFTANKLYLVISPQDTNAIIDVYLDGELVNNSNSGSDVINGKVKLDNDRLYNLIDLKGNYGNHTLKLIFENEGVNLYDFTFG